jgi:hypothetical protein
MFRPSGYRFAAIRHLIVPAASSLIPKKLAPDFDLGGNRFSEKFTRKPIIYGDGDFE